MRYFYGRVSSKDQNLARQLELAKDCDEVYTDKQSGKNFDRVAYQELMEVIKEGDTLVVKSLDRFGRDYDMIIDEWRRLKKMGVNIEVIDMPILNSSSNELIDRFISDIVLQLLSFVAETERTNTLQRQKEGIALAKERGVKFGAEKKQVAPKKKHESINEYCNRVGISRSTYYRNCAN